MGAAIIGWLTSAAAASGVLVYLLLGALVFAEDALFLGFVIPGETAAILGGALAGSGAVSIVLTISVVVLSAFLGDVVGYSIGRRAGERILRFPLLRRGDRAARAVGFVRRHGIAAVFLGRFTAFLRATTPAIAGISRMPAPRFVLANALGAIAWGTAMPLIGYFGGSAIQSAITSGFSWLAIVIVVLILSVVVARILIRRRRGALTGSGANDNDRPETGDTPDDTDTHTEQKLRVS